MKRFLFFMPKYIGVVGKRASGKDIFCTYAQTQYGITSTNTSSVLGEIAIQQGWMKEEQRFDKGILQEAGSRIGRELGPDYIVRFVAKKIQGTSHTINGMRRLEEPPALREIFGSDALILAVTAETERRYERARELGLVQDYDHFKELEGHPIESFIDDLTAGADLHLSNNGTIEEFHASIDILLQELGFSKKL